jgi:hypothetical protein
MPAMTLAIGAGIASLPRRVALVLALALALSAGIRLGQHYVAPGEPLLFSQRVRAAPPDGPHGPT